MKLRWVVSILAALPLLACAASVDMGAACPPTTASCGSASGSGGSGGNSGTGGTGGVSGVGGFAAVDGGSNRLIAEVQARPSGLAVTMVTLSCAGDCAEVTAVASGGNDPYTFTWSDGVTSASREICAADIPTLSVTVRDTEIDDGEFSYLGQTETVSVAISVLTCPDGGVDAGPETDGGLTPLCANGVSPPFQLMAKVPTATTDVFTQANGTLAEYSDPTVIGLTIVSEATIAVDIGECDQLLLAANAQGTQAVGWDNVLIVEYRPTPGAPVEARWYYGTQSTVTHVPSGQVLPLPLMPTVSGFALDPVVPNPVPFGYEPRAIDLMTQLPPGVQRFELKLYVLDAGGFGSTTEIWAIPQ